ncbi:MAG: YkgJ family cysteine cluster protein [Desulfuromonadales bacterium]|nr:YkgJ family cysteine cluster protein [Desulfuromonadales bacterium]MBN2792702.1 YkgJ family cysteine cluster protein [Desulfuromonadales bacterium]
MVQKNALTELQNKISARIVAAVEPQDPVSSLLAELRSIHLDADSLLRLNSENSHLIACRAGCAHCCVVNVSISLLEGLAITEFIRQLDEDERERLFFSLDRLWIRIRGLDDDERLALKQPCAFLDDQGHCTIYPVRPLFCRGVTSTDPEVCRSAVVSKLYGEFQPILMHHYQRQLYATLYLGIGEGLGRAGLDDRSFQLSGLVRFLLKQKPVSKTLLRQKALSWDQLYA